MLYRHTLTFMATLLASLYIAAPRVAAQAPVEPLTVVQVIERVHEGRPALAVILSQKLDPTRGYDGYLEVTRDNRIVPGSWVLEDSGQILYFPHVEPETSYRVLVRDGLASASGGRLAGSRTVTIKTRPLHASAGFASAGSVLPAGGGGLPIRSVNVDAVDVEFLRVHDDRVALLSKYIARRGSLGSYELDRLHKYLDSVYMARFDTHAFAKKGPEVRVQ